MDGGTSKRLSVIAGAVVFILTLLSQLSRPDLSIAMLVALASAVAVALLVYIAAAIVVLATPPPPPPIPEPAAPEPSSEEDPVDRLSSLEETKKIGGAERGGGNADLQQTVRLDESGLGELLPGLTAEELEKEKQNLLQALQEQGIEGPAAASENK